MIIELYKNGEHVFTGNKMNELATWIQVNDFDLVGAKSVRERLSEACRCHKCWKGYTVVKIVDTVVLTPKNPAPAPDPVPVTLPKTAGPVAPIPTAVVTIKGNDDDKYNHIPDGLTVRQMYDHCLDVIHYHTGLNISDLVRRLPIRNLKPGSTRTWGYCRYQRGYNVVRPTEIKLNRVYLDPNNSHACYETLIHEALHAVCNDNFGEEGLHHKGKWNEYARMINKKTNNAFRIQRTSNNVSNTGKAIHPI